MKAILKELKWNDFAVTKRFIICETVENFFYLEDFFHNNKPKNANSVVKYKQKLFTIVYCNTTISLI